MPEEGIRTIMCLTGQQMPDDDDNVEGWIDEMNLLSPSECKHIQEETRPMKLVLVKVIYAM